MCGLHVCERIDPDQAAVYTDLWHVQGPTEDIGRRIEPVQRLNTGPQSLSERTGSNASPDSTQEAGTGLHGSSVPALEQNHREEGSEPAKHAASRDDLQRLEQGIEAVLQRQLSRFEQGLERICDAALTRLSEQLNGVVR